MSQLVSCACGGQFWLPPQSAPAYCQCPHCGTVCQTAVAAPPIVAPPLPEPALQAPPVAYAPAMESHPGVSSPSVFSPAVRRKPPDTTLLFVGGGVAVAAVLVLVVVLNASGSKETARRASRKKPAARIEPPLTEAGPPIRAVAVPLPRESEPIPRDLAAEAAIPHASPVTTAASSPVPPPTEANPALPAWIPPLVQSHCVGCHDAQKQEGGLRLDELVGRPFEDQSSRHWKDVLQRLSNGDMPPPDKSSLSKEDRARWVAWLREEFRLLADRGPPRPTVRRLNRAEYVNTVQALTGLGLDPNEVVDDVVGSGFDTDAAELNLSPALMQQYVQLGRKIATELRNKEGRLPDLKVKLFGSAVGLDSPSLVTEEATRRLRPFATAAFRRPVEETKLARLVKIVEDKVAAGQTFDDGMQLAVQAVLCSPQFLLLTVQIDEKDDYALASKLSYFLWSAPPDAALLKLAEKGELRTGENLREQVTRLLRDPKSRALADNFGGQWLGTRELGVMQPDEEVFPQYSPMMEASMREETHLFFDYLLRQNQSITKFLDADFTFVNEPLAALYGIPNVKGTAFRKVSVSARQNRGGVLTQGSMLTITSDGVRSSPVIRGVWILENILGDPPEPPPADVPDLETDTRGTKTIREELARHRNVESCNSCHRKIDPLGFALENYDAIGQWRTHYPTAKPPLIPIDNVGEMTDGTTVAGVAQLKRALINRKQDFARCLTEKLLAYGCSRKVDFRDEETVEKIVQAVAADDYRFQTLIQATVHSAAFRGADSQ